MHAVHDSETPAVAQQVITACAFIHHDFDGIEKVFLPKRAASKKFMPSVFELVGGHIDFGEDPVIGLKREIREELGMESTIGDPFFVFTYTNHIKGSHSIEVIYFAQFVGDIDLVILHPDDHSKAAWFALNEIEQAASSLKPVDDIEFIAIRKGFGLLSGEALAF